MYYLGLGLRLKWSFGRCSKAGKPCPKTLRKAAMASRTVFALRWHYGVDNAAPVTSGKDLIYGLPCGWYCHIL